MEWIKEAIGGKICALGQDVILKGSGEDVVTKAVIDPVHSVSEAARNYSGLPDGYFLPGSYQYFGLAEASLEDVTVVVSGEKHYQIRRRERYEAGGCGLYWWALLIRCGEQDA